MIPKVCPDCQTVCLSLVECLKQQDFNLIVDDARQIAKLKKHIKSTVPHFKGLKKWLSSNPEGFGLHDFSEIKEWRSRFLTITFSPKKFSFNELTQPQKLINYALNCIYSLKNLFKDNPYIVVEYHKSGIPHIHLNYSCVSVLEHSTLILRLQYYFAENLRNKKCIHDRMFNDGGINYIQKSNKQYYTFK